jgi:hypothetical protein
MRTTKKVELLPGFVPGSLTEGVFCDDTIKVGPIHSCVLYELPAHSADEPIPSTITYRRNAVKKKWYSAGALHFYK